MSLRQLVGSLTLAFTAAIATSQAQAQNGPSPAKLQSCMTQAVEDAKPAGAEVRVINNSDGSGFAVIGRQRVETQAKDGSTLIREQGISSSYTKLTRPTGEELGVIDFFAFDDELDNNSPSTSIHDQVRASAHELMDAADTSKADKFDKAGSQASDELKKKTKDARDKAASTFRKCTGNLSS